LTEDARYEEYQKAIKFYSSLDYFELIQQIEQIQKDLRPIEKKLRFMEAAMRLREI